MKKLALILAIMLIPCAAFGLEMLDDSTMDNVTGQAGVSIAFDDLQMFLNIDTMAYIDCDGFNTYTGNNCTGAGGALAIGNFQIDVLNINAIISSTTSDGGSTQSGDSMALYSVACGDIPLFYNYANSGALTGCFLGSESGVGGLTTQGTAGLDNYTRINQAGATNGFQAQALTIDVTDELPALSEGWANNMTGINETLAGVSDLGTATIGGILISVPTMEIYINSMNFTPYYTGYIGDQTSHAANDVHNAKAITGIDSNFGTFELDGVTFSILSGWLEIAPH